jgi:hypothetical protein
VKLKLYGKAFGMFVLDVWRNSRYGTKVLWRNFWYGVWRNSRYGTKGVWRKFFGMRCIAKIFGTELSFMTKFFWYETKGV